MSDHIPDVTKMIGETPRTDVLLVVHDLDPKPDTIINHARQLERELNAMTRERDIELERATHYRDRWQYAEERIKRLEEAGDAMVETTTTPAAEAWHKAKEAKP